MQTVIDEPKAEPQFPATATLVNQINGQEIRLAFRRWYRMEAERDVRTTRRPSAVLKHIVAADDYDAVLVVAPRVEILSASPAKRVRIRFLVDGKVIFKGHPLEFTHDTTGPLANPPKTFFYGADDAGCRLGLFLPNGSKVAMHVEGIKGRVRARLNAALYTTRV